MWQILKETAAEFSRNRCTSMAAAIAYYAAFSLAPLVILVTTIGGTLWQESEVKEQVKNEVREVVGDDGAEQVDKMVESAKKHRQGLWGSIITGVVLLIAATGVLAQFQVSLNTAWGVEANPEKINGILNVILKRLLSLGMIVVVAFLLVVSSALTGLVDGAGSQFARWLSEDVSGTLLTFGNSVVTLVVSSLLFATMFKLLPDARVAWKDVALSALLTGVLSVLGKYAVGVYLARSNVNSAFGAAGSFATILIWVYYSTAIVLLGAEFTKVWARQHGRPIEPSDHARRIST